MLAKVSNGRDAVAPGDYYADSGRPCIDADMATGRRAHEGEQGTTTN